MSIVAQTLCCRATAIPFSLTRAIPLAHNIVAMATTMFIFTADADSANGTKAGFDQQVSNASRLVEGAVLTFEDYHCPRMTRLTVADNGTVKSASQKMVVLDADGKPAVQEKRYLRLKGTIDGVAFDDIAPSMFVNNKPAPDGIETYRHDGPIHEGIKKALESGTTLGQQGEALMTLLKGKSFKLTATHTWWDGNFEKHIWDLVPNV